MEMLLDNSWITLGFMIEKNGILVQFMVSNGDILVLSMKICTRTTLEKVLTNLQMLSIKLKTNHKVGES